jgi:O-acetyl-ADP-ribose deacetylase (regulator of RNase III)
MLAKGDITKQKVEAIVNAANMGLRGGGGVDGAIHRAAGPELLKECLTLNGCPTGEACITKGYNLTAQWVIHTVGPVWRGGKGNEDQLLSQCYKSCFVLVKKRGIRSIAFPSISTGAYRFPVDRAVRIAIATTRKCVSVCPSLEKVVFVCFDEKTYDLYETILREV